MSDPGRDSAVEERLGSALGQLADTTTVSPHGWERIERRASARRRRRVVAGWVAAPALAAAMVVALVTATGRDADPQVAAGPGDGHAFYAPKEPGDEYRLTYAATSRSDGVPAGRVRVYGRRAADGVTLDAAILVVTGIGDGDALLLRSPDDGASANPARVHGQDATVSPSGDGSMVVWTEQAGPTIAVIGRGSPSFPFGEGTGAGEGDLLAVAEAVDFDDGDARATTLPPGFSETYRGRWPPLPENRAERVTEQSWSDADDPLRDFTLTVSEEAGISLDARTWLVTDLRTSAVGGQTALYSPREHSLSWIARPGVLVVLTGPGLSEAEVHFLAGGVGPLDEAGWRRLVDDLDPSGQPSGHRFVIAEGIVGAKRWAVASYEGAASSRIGLCVEVSTVEISTVEINTGGRAMGDCGAVATDITAMGQPQLFSSPDTAIGNFLVVAVDKGVAAGRLERADGTSVPLPLSGASAGLPVNFLVTRLSGLSAARALVALDAGGQEVARQEMPGPPPAPGPMPADAPPPPFVPRPASPVSAPSGPVPATTPPTSGA